jgi:hypothetical protein
VGRGERNEGAALLAPNRQGPMTSPLLPLTLAISAVGAEAASLHRAAFYLVLAAIVPAAASELADTGELADGRQVLLRVTCGGAGLVLLVLSSAVRANVAHGSPPPIALASLVGALAAFAVVLLARLVVAPHPFAEPADL